MISQNQLTEQTLGNLLDFQTICPVYNVVCLLMLYFFVMSFILYVLFLYSIMLQSWDIETNSRPVERMKYLSVCHGNLNSVWVDDIP